MATSTLEMFLKQRSWLAVDEARRQGPTALPVIERFINDEDYQKRQIAVACAGSINDNGAAPILVAGIKDSNINVRIEAARQLGERPYTGVTDDVLEQLTQSKDEVFRELLALAAGWLPGENTVGTLKKIVEDKEKQDAKEKELQEAEQQEEKKEEEEGEEEKQKEEPIPQQEEEEEQESKQVAINAQMALAKLGDAEARRVIVSELSAEQPRTRYDALAKLIYIDAPKLATHAKRLLRDKNPAFVIGSIRNPQYRRVCDQAVDTFVALLNLQVRFRVSPERIYNDEELLQVQTAIGDN